MSTSVVGSYSTRADADFVAAYLRDAGIPAKVATDSAGGAYPPFDSTHGVRVLVPEQNLDYAFELIAELSPPEEGSRRSAFQRGIAFLLIIGLVPLVIVAIVPWLIWQLGRLLMHDRLLGPQDPADQGQSR